MVKVTFIVSTELNIEVGGSATNKMVRLLRNGPPEHITRAHMKRDSNTEMVPSVGPTTAHIPGSFTITISTDMEIIRGAMGVII